MTTNSHRSEGTTGVLVVRAWSDSGRFRARVTATHDVQRAAVHESVTASRTEVLRLVEAWLEEAPGA